MRTWKRWVIALCLVLGIALLIFGGYLLATGLCEADEYESLSTGTPEPPAVAE